MLPLCQNLPDCYEFVRFHRIVLFVCAVITGAVQGAPERLSQRSHPAVSLGTSCIWHHLSDAAEDSSSSSSSTLPHPSSSAHLHRNCQVY